MRLSRVGNAGHLVLYVAESQQGAGDQDVLDLANSQDAPLLTQDKDFGELVYRLKRLHTGVILLRLAGLSAELKSDLTARAIRDHGVRLAGSFTVISVSIIRIRRDQ
ncbi:MAG: DUF5615 family PIN-like protein [Acidobacteria bacterium]|nr:DUF5615 family PIN-like protein [Acidobacteriota bacterium]